ncbi:MAG: nitrate/nitrite transporter, partial [Salinigranum sp.]
MSLRTRLSSLARYDALVLASLIWFLAKFLRYAFPPLFGTLQDTYGVSNTVLGTAFTGFMLVYAAMQFPSGVLADRLGSVRVIVAGALVASATALALFVPAPFAVLVVGMLLVGFGTGMHKTVSVGLLSRAYSNRPGRALGVFDTIGGFGGAVAPVVIVAFAAFGWRSVFLVGGLAGVVLAVLFAYQVPRRLPESTHATAEADPDADLRSYLAMFGDRRFTAFVLVTILVSFAFNGVVAFLPLYLTDYAGLTPAFASAVYGAMFAVTLVQPVTGELSDRIGQLPIIGVTVVLATAGLGGLLFLSGPYALAASVLVVLYAGFQSL